MTSVGEPSCHRDAVPMKSKQSNVFCEAVDATVCKGDNDGHQVAEICCDNTFSKLMDDVQDNMNTEMECVAPEEHEAAAERNDRTSLRLKLHDRLRTLKIFLHEFDAR